MAHGFDELAQAGEQSERITIAFLALAWFFIILRVWTRTWIITSFGWDDATMILAGVSITVVRAKTCLELTPFQMIFTIFSGSQLYIEANGGGTHVMSYEGLEKLTKVSISE